jgi:hypothetical protein
MHDSPRWATPPLPRSLPRNARPADISQHYHSYEWMTSKLGIGFMSLRIPYWTYRNSLRKADMTTSLAHFPANLPLVAPFIASLRKGAAAPRLTTKAAASAAGPSVWSLYRMASADSVSPKLAAALAARAAD